MKTVFTFLLLMFFCVPAFAEEGQKLGIAAVVNNEVITFADVVGRYNMAVHGANMQPNESEQKALQRQALDALIDEQIRLQEASKLGITPTDAEVDDAFNKLAQQNNASPDQFKSMLKQMFGVYDSLRHQIKAQIAWSNVVKKKIRPQVNVGENDINSYIAEKEKNPAKVEYQVAEIFLKNTDANQKLATQLVAEIRSGQQPHFSVVARQFSEGMEASKGGLLGWIPENRLEPELDQSLKTLKAGQISDPITSSRGLHILMLLEKRDVLPVKQAIQTLNLKQILIPVPMNVDAETNDKAMEQAKFLQDKAKDCPSMNDTIQKINAPTAKDMGNVKLSDLPTVVVTAVKDLPVGKISPIIRSQDSIALYMVCGREASGDSDVREDVANIIGNERLTRMQYRYYRDLRAAAYVDIK